MGSGYGLLITKNLAKKLNIGIEVKSELNKGSEFSIILNFENTDKIEEEVNIIPILILKKLIIIILKMIIYLLISMKK